MTYIDYGLGVISAGVMDAYPTALPFDLADVYQALSMQGRLVGMEMHERFYEIGSLSGSRKLKHIF